ncbi:MAG: hypothetical protein ACI9SB_001681, partial [Candidatus Azotimanducaceae bacterium]
TGWFGTSINWSIIALGEVDGSPHLSSSLHF